MKKAMKRTARVYRNGATEETIQCVLTDKFCSVERRPARLWKDETTGKHYALIHNYFIEKK